MKKWIHAVTKVKSAKLVTNKDKGKRIVDQFKHKYPKAYEVLGQ